MHLQLQDVVGGFAVGAIYGLVALALVLIYRSTGILNFAQGELATFTTFISWSIIVGLGVPYWLGFIATLAIAAVIGLVVYVLTILPVQHASEFTVVMITFGLFEVFNGMSSSIWNQNTRSFPTPFSGSPIHLFGAFISQANLGIFIVSVAVMLALVVLFRFSKLGRGLRAAAQNPTAARLVGVKVNAMYAVGWMLASMVGAIAGMLIASVLFLNSSMMLNVLIFAFLAGILGGLNSPLGAVVGGLAVGIVDNIAGTISVIGSALETPVVLVLIVIVLLVRPTGLFGKRVQRRV